MKESKKKKMTSKKQPKPHPVDVCVGRRIRHFRNLRKMSQSTLAQKLGVRFQQVQKYESAGNRISASKELFSDQKEILLAATRLIMPTEHTACPSTDEQPSIHCARK